MSYEKPAKNKGPLIKKTFRISVIVDKATKEFKKGLGVGVLVYQDVSFNLTEQQYASGLFAMELIEHEDRLLKEVCKTQIVELSAI